MAEKPVMNVDDVYLILYHHWVLDTATFPDGRQRLQLDFLELIIGDTASRPGALVYVKRNEKRIKGYCIGEDDSEEDSLTKRKITPTGRTKMTRRYVTGTSRCCCSRIQTVFETCWPWR